jgi:hypothetical protein
MMETETTQNNPNNAKTSMHPERIVGIAELNAHFHLSVIKVKADTPSQKRYSSKRKGYTDELYKGLTFFYIVARIDEKHLLEEIQEFFGCGHIERFEPVNSVYEKFQPEHTGWNKSPMRLRQNRFAIFDENPLDPKRAQREIINYHVTNPYDLRTKIIPFFEKHPFHSKRMRFMLKGFKRGVDYCLEYSEFLKLQGLMTQNTTMEGSYLEGDELHKFRNLVKRLPSREDECFYIAPRAARRRRHLQRAHEITEGVFDVMVSKDETPSDRETKDLENHNPKGRESLNP